VDETALEYSTDDEYALQSDKSSYKLDDQAGGRQKNNRYDLNARRKKDTAAIRPEYGQSKRPRKDLDQAPNYRRDDYDDDDHSTSVQTKDFATLAFVSPLTLQTLKSIQQLSLSCSAVLLDTDPEPRTRAEAMRGPESKEWDAAMKEEHKSLVDNDTWDVVPRPRNRKVLKSRVQA
jgi:hypothetical protein